MTHDPLARLVDVDLVTRAPDLPAVMRRARGLRRARYARRTGGIAVAVTALVVGGVTIPQPGGQPGPGQDAPVALALGALPARASDVTGVDCDGAESSWADRADWSAEPGVVEAASLIEEAPFPLTGVGVYRQDWLCSPAAPVAVLFDDDPVLGVSVWADVADPFGGMTDGVHEVEVRGADGRVRDLGNGALYLAWWEPDGTRWMASGSGLDEPELLAVLDDLTFTGARVLDAASVPDGLQVAPSGTPPPTSGVSHTWWATYGEPNAMQFDAEGYGRPVPGSGLELQVTSAWQPAAELAASYYAAEVRFADVDGVRAVFAPWGDPAVDVGGWLTWQVDGVTYRLSGAEPVESLVEVAHRVQPVSLGDPQVLDAPQYPPAEG